ncbi:hypothetical protein [Synechococcus sp. CBW1107]|uniref:PASTA domain-containing protein n=1 Tax=Synechococcus sp. CBW1107 TaxID=2789857 RepID=UPI002AD435A5|nr:hypothetical protein [Synechococcus sp. CBW1107]CAK6687229.1 hypothetical protein IFHNHDMJ_00159 [Synechococcus sp. CBW1107]
MGQLAAILVATAIMGLMAPPMMRLALLPAETSRQKSNFSLAESNAIAVRKQAAEEGRVNFDGLTIPDGCTKKADAVPRGQVNKVSNFVECESGEGKSFAVAWQPLYLSSELGAGDDGTEDETEGEADICYSLYDKNGDWQSDNEKKRLEFGDPKQNVFRGSASEVGQIALATKSPPGKSVSSSAELYVRVHDISDEDCSKVDASVKPPQISSGGEDGESDSKECTVPNYVGKTFSESPNKSKWNETGKGKFDTDGYHKTKRNKVVDQDPSPGKKVDCDEDLELEFDD